MRMVRFGKTGLQVSEIALGGIPIQRRTKADAVAVVKAALDLGINFIDTAHGYGDSEEKIGEAIRGVPREGLVLASKAPATDRRGFLEQLETTLERLGTDYVDIYQHHGVSSEEKMEAVLGPGGAYEGMVEAVAAGKVRHPAFSSHDLAVAKRMMLTGNYEVTQLPFNFIDDAALDEVIPLARELDMGFISMKPLGGGRFERAEPCFRYLMQFDGIVPDPGIENIGEIEEIVSLYENRREITDDDREEIRRLKEELGTSWCHRCDYCQPCPQGIRISAVLVAKSMVRRMPPEKVNTKIGQAVAKAAECTECGECVPRCPYNLAIPELLKVQRGRWAEYEASGVWP